VFAQDSERGEWQYKNPRPSNMKPYECLIYIFRSKLVFLFKLVSVTNSNKRSFAVKHYRFVMYQQIARLQSKLMSFVIVSHFH